MKKSLLCLTALLMLGTASTANAGAFFGLRVGAEKYKVDNNSQNLEEGRTDFLMGGFLGYHWSFFRLEVEYLYHPQRSFQGGLTKMESQTVMGNLYFAPPVRSVLHPYFMGGGGAAFHSTKVTGDSDKNTAFTWQIGGGLELEFTENVFLDAGVRWMDMGNAKLNDEKYDVRGLSYFAGLRFEY